jgi:hypothetical protein
MKVKLKGNCVSTVEGIVWWIVVVEGHEKEREPFLRAVVSGS